MTTPRETAIKAIEEQIGANEIWLAQHNLLPTSETEAPTAIHDINAAHPEIHPAWVEINDQPSTPEVKLTEDDKEILCEMAGIPAGARMGCREAANAAGGAVRKFAGVEKSQEPTAEPLPESIKYAAEKIPSLSQVMAQKATGAAATIWPNNGRNENKLHEAIKTIVRTLPEDADITIRRGAIEKGCYSIELALDNGGSHFYLGDDIDSIEKIIDAHQTLQQFAAEGV